MTPLYTPIDPFIIKSGQDQALKVASVLIQVELSKSRYKLESAHDREEREKALRVQWGLDPIVDINNL